jgi:hypothetical protein
MTVVFLNIGVCHMRPMVVIIFKGYICFRLKREMARKSITLEITTPSVTVKSAAFEMLRIVGMMGRAEI